MQITTRIFPNYFRFSLVILEQLQNTRPLHLHVPERFKERGITQ